MGPKHCHITASLVYIWVTLVLASQRIWSSSITPSPQDMPTETNDQNTTPIKWSNFLYEWCNFFFFYLILFFNFTILYWFCHISKWIRHRYTCVPYPEPSSLFPPHTIPLDHPSAPAPNIQYRASNLDWHLISYMIFYMFHCYFRAEMLVKFVSFTLLYLVLYLWTFFWKFLWVVSIFLGLVCLLFCF